MGIDAGSDMVPRLSRGAVDKQNWQSFIELIRELYQNDGLVETKPNYLEFNAGEHPRLPFEGHKFLRFSSKVSGRYARRGKNCSMMLSLKKNRDEGWRIKAKEIRKTEEGFQSAEHVMKWSVGHRAVKPSHRWSQS